MRHAEACHNFIKNQKTAVSCSFGSEGFQKAVGRRHHPHVSGDGFDNDRRHFLPQPVHDTDKALTVIIDK